MTARTSLSRLSRLLAPCLVLLTLLWLSLAECPAAVLLNTNLLVNPGAETGNTAGWVCPDRQWVAAAEITPHGGSYMFWPGGGSVADTKMYQDVDLAGLTSTIDSGTLYMHLSGWLANWDQYPHDRATLSLYALDANGATLAFYSADHRSPVWAQYRFDKPIPAGTRVVRVELRATRFVGVDDDGYFDDLSLVVNATPGPAVTVTSQGGTSHMNVNGTLQLGAATVGGSDSGYDWSSSFAAVATVDANGLVTGRSTGRATISARGRDSGATGLFEVSVIPVNGLVITQPTAGKSVAGGATLPVTWDVVGTVGSATLHYSLDGGVSFTQVATIPDATVGQYAWTTPTVAADVRNALLKLSYGSGDSLSSLFSIVVPTLSLSMGGDGAGSVYSSPAGIACASGSATGCLYSFSGGESVELTAVAEYLSVFNGWSGCDSVTLDKRCSLLMDGARSVVATFTAAPRAKIGDTGYPTLNAAYTAAPSVAGILALDAEYVESLNMNLGKNITLSGGYDGGYSAPSGTTVLNGTLSIASGQLVANRVAVR